MANVNITEVVLQNIDLYLDGERASAAIFNRPITQLRDNQIAQNTMLDEIYAAFGSDNLDLDTLQEVIDKIEEFQETAGDNSPGETTSFLGGVSIDEGLSVGGSLSVVGSITMGGDTVATEDWVTLNAVAPGGVVDITTTTDFTGDGVTDTFAFDFVSNSVGIYIEGLKIDAGDYTLNYSGDAGISVTFDVPPTQDDFISCVAYGGADVYTKAQADIVTDQKIEAAAIAYVTKTSTYTAESKDYIFADTLAGTFTITLPITPTIGDTVTILDTKSNFSTANITVDRNGETIMGVAADLTLDVDNGKTELIYTGSDWRY